MPEFVLDTGSPEHARAFNALDGFTRGYIEALFFTDEERLCEQSDGGREMPNVAIDTATMQSHFVGGNSFGFADLAPKTLAKIVADCAAFQTANRALLDEAYSRDYDDEQAGRDFWYTRNGHGVGYWDRKALETDGASYEALTDAMGANPVDSVVWRSLRLRRESLLADSLGERLSKAAQACGGRDSCVGDDGLVYLD